MTSTSLAYVPESLELNARSLKFWLVVSCFLMMASVCFLVFQHWRSSYSIREHDEALAVGWGARDPLGPQQLWVINPRSRMSVSTQEKWRKLGEMFYKSSVWGQEDEKYILDCLSIPARRIDFDGDITISDNEATSTIDSALDSFNSRYVRGLPIEPEVGRAIKAKARELLDSPNDSVRLSALVTVNWTGMLLDEEVLSKVKRMYDDPKPLVAGMARRIVSDMTLPKLQASWKRSRAHMGF